MLFGAAAENHRIVKTTDSAYTAWTRVFRTAYEMGFQAGSRAGSQVESTLRGQAKAQLFSFHDYQQRQSLKNNLLEKIRGLLTLSAGWDGYTAKVPVSGAIDDAEQFTSNLLPSDGFTLPTVTAASDGEVNFSWKNSLGYIDLGFYGDQTYSYYVRLQNGEELLSDESPLSESLPTKVIDIIRGS
ncbi:hypothetical protein D3C84_744010 [compost metagenome]